MKKTFLRKMRFNPREMKLNIGKNEKLEFLGVFIIDVQLDLTSCGFTSCYYRPQQ